VGRQPPVFREGLLGRPMGRQLLSCTGSSSFLVRPVLVWIRFCPLFFCGFPPNCGPADDRFLGRPTAATPWLSPFLSTSFFSTPPHRDVAFSARFFGECRLVSKVRTADTYKSSVHRSVEIASSHVVSNHFVACPPGDFRSFGSFQPSPQTTTRPAGSIGSLKYIRQVKPALPRRPLPSYLDARWRRTRRWCGRRRRLRARRGRW
jgi:hypothetical protein